MIDFEKLAERQKAAEAELREGNHQVALDEFLKVQEDAAKSGLVSPHNAWLQAVALDYLGNLEGAYAQMRRAVALDPLSISFRNSLDIFIGRIQRAAVSGAAEKNQDVLRLYQLLLDAGAASPDVHLAMTQLHLDLGHVEQAARIADALVITAPSPEILRLVASIRRAQSDEPRAMDAEEQAASLQRKQAPPPTLRVVVG